MGTNDNKVVGGLDQVLGVRDGGPAGYRGELAIGCRLPIG